MGVGRDWKSTTESSGLGTEEFVLVMVSIAVWKHSNQKGLFGTLTLHPVKEVRTGTQRGQNPEKGADAECCLWACSSGLAQNCFLASPTLAWALRQQSLRKCPTDFPAT